MREQRGLLKNDADAACLRRTPALTFNITPDLAAERDRAGVGPFEARDLPQDRRLARAGRPEEHEDGPWRELRVDNRRDGDAAPLVPAPRLAADLDGLVARAASAGVAVRVEITGDERPLPPGVDRAAFRIAQEALTNVARHANASRVWLRLEADAAEMRLTVRDDGSGFDCAAAEARASRLGMTTMKERMDAAGGSLALESAPGKGTTLTARVPF